MDLDGVANELYGLTPSEFVATRNAREKEARALGRRDLATEIRALGKPTTVAWLANQLVRERSDQIGPLLELGAALREATATLSGADLRRLSPQRHRVVQALVREASGIGTATGHRVSDETARGLEETLHAALADPALADQLASGRLTDGLQHIGFLPAGSDPRLSRGARVEDRRVESATEHDRGRPPRAEQRRAEARRAQHLERAKRDVTEARAGVQTAAAARVQAHTQLDKAAAVARDLTEEVATLRAALGRAEGDHGLAQREERRAWAAVDTAERAEHEAQRHLANAEARWDQLTNEAPKGG